MFIPTDYADRVYAGVLGKIIGVYLGRPFEGWTYERIMRELGEITYYVQDKLNFPMIVGDDDLLGTFTFLRALPDHGNCRDLTPEQIGRTWLNYIVEKRSIIWWSGRGNSTEHTAYLNLKNGIPAPQSGSMAQNGRVVAEQIGAQIYIDGWAMVAPGDPELAADLARRAASVSHDGEGIYGAQVVAAIEAQAFIEPDINKLIDTATALIPKESLIYRLITDIRDWHSQEEDWRKTREKIAAKYGYDKYGGNCHMIPNHALVIHALLHGDDDFQKSLMIVNTCGWDTDCNSGNVGCILGIKNGLVGLTSGPDWRGPVADRIFLPTADGGRSITDALTEAYHIVNIGRSLAGLDVVEPKNGARFHFNLPGAVQGFLPEDSIDVKGTTRLENVPGHSQSGQHSLAIHYSGIATGRASRTATATFIPSEENVTWFEDLGYRFLCSPSLYSGQKIEARVTGDRSNNRAVNCNLYIRKYGDRDQKVIMRGPQFELEPGTDQVLIWQVPDTDGAPVVEVGLEITSAQRSDGTLYLDYLTWDGVPHVTFHRQNPSSLMWKRAWVNTCDNELTDFNLEDYRLAQNHGRGLLIQGTRDWEDYLVSATLTPHACSGAGICVRVQGQNRYYALLLSDNNTIRLVKVLDVETILAEESFNWQFGSSYNLALQIQENHLTASVDGQVIFDEEDTNQPLTNGALALICEKGRVGYDNVTVQPAS